MDALEFTLERNRMCRSSHCEGCPTLGKCTMIETIENTKKLIAIVEQWSKEHPKKTYLMKFKEMFPDAPLESDGYPMCRPCHLGWIALSVCPDHFCDECWDKPCEEGKP